MTRACEKRIYKIEAIRVCGNTNVILTSSYSDKHSTPSRITYCNTAFNAKTIPHPDIKIVRKTRFVMRLRSTTRLPERYLDGDQPETRRRASSIERSSHFNPDLPPAAFPTLEYPPTVKPQESGVASNSVLNSTKLIDDAIQLELRPKKATVFHAQKDSTGQVELGRFTTGYSSSDHTDPVEYDGWQAMANSNDTPRIGLSAYEVDPSWSQVSDDVKLVLFEEMMAIDSFNDVAKKLTLTDTQRENMKALFRREVAREARGDAKIKQVQAAQLRMLMSGGSKISQDAVSESFDDLYSDIEEPAASKISKTDITCAQKFLRAVNLNGYVSGLWRYEGVSLDSINWNNLSIEDPPDTLKTASTENRRRRHPTSGSADNDLDISARRKGKTSLEKAGGPASKRKRRMAKVDKIGVPSPLRTYMSHNSEEKVVSGTAATKASLVSESQPEMLAPLQSQVEKQHTAQSIPFAMKSSAKAQSPKTQATQTSNTTKSFTNSLLIIKPRPISSLEQIRFSHLTHRSEETLPQVQETRLDSSPTDLRQPTSFIQEDNEDVDKPLISENERSATTVPLMKVSLTTGGKSAENIGHDEKNKYIENADQILADPVSVQHSHPDQEFATQVEDNTPPVQRRRKRQKKDDDAPWRASGQRKSKFPVRTEPPARRNRTST